LENICTRRREGTLKKTFTPGEGKEHFGKHLRQEKGGNTMENISARTRKGTLWKTSAPGEGREHFRKLLRQEKGRDTSVNISARRMEGTLRKTFAQGQLYSAAAGHNIGLDWALCTYLIV
jgi:hypothetical protein